MLVTLISYEYCFWLIEKIIVWIYTLRPRMPCTSNLFHYFLCFLHEATSAMSFYCLSSCTDTRDFIKIGFHASLYINEAWNILELFSLCVRSFVERVFVFNPFDNRCLFSQLLPRVDHVWMIPTTCMRHFYCSGVVALTKLVRVYSVILVFVTIFLFFL